MEANQQPTKFQRGYGRYMLVIGTGGNIFFYIQAWEIFRTQSARDISLVAFIVAFWAVASWFGYGLMLRDKVIICANIVAMIGAGLIVAGKLIYG